MRKLTLILLVTASTLLLVAPSAFSHNNSAPTGKCDACHSGGSAPAFINVDGLPEKYTPGRVYNVSITVESNNKSYGEVQGGFSLNVNGGELRIADSKNTQISHQTETSQPFLTHTKKGSNMRKWRVKWKAPTKKMTAKVQIMGIAANGDFSPAGDSAGAELIDIKPQ